MRVTLKTKRKLAERRARRAELDKIMRDSTFFTIGRLCVCHRYPRYVVCKRGRRELLTVISEHWYAKDAIEQAQRIDALYYQGMRFAVLLRGPVRC